MSEPAPWQCPQCLTWIAPHVSGHRCGPPEPGVPVTPDATGPVGSTGTSISTAALPGTITVNVSGAVVSENDLIETVRNGLLKQSASNWHGCWHEDERSAWEAAREPVRIDGTARELIEALQQMPPDLPVTRYCDEIVESVELRDYGRDEGSGSTLHRTQHVALW